MTATSKSFLYHIEVNGVRISTHVNKQTAMYWFDLRKRAGLSVKLYQESHIGFLRLA